jgi:hypothetical protein
MNTFVSILWLVIELITLAAFARIISRSGFSIVWILVPLLPVVLTLVLFTQATSGSLFFAHDTGIVLARLAPAGYLDLLAAMNSFKIPGAGVIFYLDLISTVGAWIFFVLFAFLRWPAVDTGGSRRLRLRLVDTRTADIVPAPETTASKSNFNNQRFGRPAAPAASLPQPSGVGGSAPVLNDGATAVVYCAWCGKERALNAQAIHHCGSKSRPVVFCTGCGASLVPGDDACTSCNLPVG